MTHTEHNFKKHLLRRLSARTLTRVALLTALATPAFLASAAHAGNRANDMARAELMRVHVRITREIMNSPEIDEARKAVALAHASLYQVRENILTQVRQGEAYGDLKLALWHQQQQLQGLHTEIPVKIYRILETARDSLSIRTRISSIEFEALEASDDYLAARDEANARMAEYQQLLRDAEEKVRNDPELLAMSAQVRAMSGLRSGRPSTYGRAQ